LGRFAQKNRQKSTKNAKNRSGFLEDLLILLWLESLFAKIGVIFFLYLISLSETNAGSQKFGAGTWHP
jgi:hypothetical protein